MKGDLITVFGGSGFIGRYLVRALCKAGARVRVATRRPHLAPDLRVPGDVGQVHLVQANVRDAASVERAVDGADAVVNLVGILFESGPQKFSTTQEEGAKTVAETAAAAGITRLVHVSAIGADPDGAAQYARTKGRGEAHVRAAVPTAAIVRPSIVFGPEDDFFNRFAAMARFSPALPLIKGKTRFQPVYVGDVADAIVAALSRADAQGRVFELGGPTVYTFKELLQLMLREIDRPRFLAPVPTPFAHMLGFFGDVSGALPFVDPFLTRDQVLMLANDNIAGQAGGDAGTIEDLEIGALETVEAIIPTYLERYRRYGQFHERSA